MATQEVKRARITAIVFAAMTVLTIISFAYAFFQKKEAWRNESLAKDLLIKGQEQDQIQKENIRLANAQNSRLETVVTNLQAELRAVQEELKKCKGR